MITHGWPGGFMLDGKWMWNGVWSYSISRRSVSKIPIHYVVRSQPRALVIQLVARHNQSNYHSSNTSTRSSSLRNRNFSTTSTCIRIFGVLNNIYCWQLDPTTRIHEWLKTSGSRMSRISG